VSVGSPEYLAHVRNDALVTVTEFALAKPFPNPMRNSASIDLALPRDESDVRVDVMDASGRLVRTVAAGPFVAGIHRIEWDGRTSAGNRAGPGLYFIRAQAGAQTTNRKVALIP
jgi:flagellar hook assembly protein FlgD